MILFLRDDLPLLASSWLSFDFSVAPQRPVCLPACCRQAAGRQQAGTENPENFYPLSVGFLCELRVSVVRITLNVLRLSENWTCVSY